MSEIKIREKRARSSNFEKGEVLSLTELVTKYRSVIENKKTDAVTNKDKEVAWEKIALAFNASSSGSVRSIKNLKNKYESIKKNAKKKAAVHRQEFYKTGGGPPINGPDFDEAEQKILDICSNISGLEPRNDSDNIGDIGEPEIVTIIWNDQAEISEEAKITIENDKTISDVIEVDMDGSTITQAIGLIEPKVDVPISQEMKKNELPKEPDLMEPKIDVPISKEAKNKDVPKKPDSFKWNTWNPKALKSKTSDVLKANKASVTAKLDTLSSARLELVQLQLDLTKKEYEFKKKEHDMKILHMENEEKRKQEIHNLTINKLLNKEN